MTNRSNIRLRETTYAKLKAVCVLTGGAISHTASDAIDEWLKNQAPESLVKQLRDRADKLEEDMRK